MLYVLAYIAMYVGSVLVGVLWNLVLFKSQYAHAVGEVLREAPIFPVGLTAVALNCAVILTVFSMLYPKGSFSPALGIGLFCLLWAPNLVGSFATAAKMKVAHVLPYMVFETGFALTNAVVLGLVSSLIFARM